MKYTRQTVAADTTFEGKGLHSGVPVTVVVRPAKDGITFRVGKEKTKAIPENVTDTSRCTTLGQIGTIEHLMSALAGLEITDADIELTAPELPALDGSAAEFYRGLKAAGLAGIGEAEVTGPFTRVFVQEARAKIAIAKGEGWWRYLYDTGERWPGQMEFETENVLEGYEYEIAPARTFGLEEELPMIKQMGLAQGLDQDSALVLGAQGYVNAPRFDNEPPRHKLLDCIGDLYLAGIPVRFLDVVAERTGHRLNVQAAKLLAEGRDG